MKSEIALPIMGRFLVKELRKAVGAKYLGVYKALTGWSYINEPILHVKFDRGNVVHYYNNDKLIGSFQDYAYLDD